MQLINCFMTMSCHYSTFMIYTLNVYESNFFLSTLYQYGSTKLGSTDFCRIIVRLEVDAFSVRFCGANATQEYKRADNLLAVTLQTTLLIAIAEEKAVVLRRIFEY